MDDEAWESAALVHYDDDYNAIPLNSTQDVFIMCPDERQKMFLAAAQSGDMNLLQAIHHLCGDDVLNVTDEDHYTALHKAAYNGHVQISEYLLGAGANFAARTVDGWQPLHCACRWNKVTVASLLLQSGADVNAQTNGGLTPLHLAASLVDGGPTIQLLLFQSNINVTLKSSQGEMAQELAWRCGNSSYLFEMVEDCIDYRRFYR